MVFHDAVDFANTIASDGTELAVEDTGGLYSYGRYSYGHNYTGSDGTELAVEDTGGVDLCLD